MTAKSMDVFLLRDTVVGEYRKTRHVVHHDPCGGHPRAGSSDLRRRPVLPRAARTINPSYCDGDTLDRLVAAGELEARTAEIFRVSGVPLALYKHQQQAIALASQGESYVVTRRPDV